MEKEDNQKESKRADIIKLVLSLLEIIEKKSILVCYDKFNETDELKQIIGDQNYLEVFNRRT